jgi:hypothetical protein
MGAAEEARLHGVVGDEIELLDPSVPDPDSVVIPPRRRRRRRADAIVERWSPSRSAGPASPDASEASRHRDPVKEDYAASVRGRAVPISCCWRALPAGWRSLSRIISRANMAGTKAVPRFRHELLEDDHDDVVALSGCRTARSPGACGSATAPALGPTAERYAGIFGRGDGPRRAGSSKITTSMF